MPKSKLDKLGIAKLYQKQTIDYLLFGFIKGQLSAMPTLTLEQSLFNSLEYFGLSDNFEPETVKYIYHDIQRLFKENKGL